MPITRKTLPECSGRVEKAVAIVLSGDVELLPDGRARVGSQSNGEMIYRLVNGTCECRDFEHAPGHWCKHKIAAGIAKRAGLPPVTTAHAHPQQAETHATEPVQGIDPKWLTYIHDKPFVVYAGLLHMAREAGLVRLEAQFISVTPDMALASATATFADGRTFREAADATPGNVNAKVRQHFPRLALTRAKARCLRDALGIDMAAVEELD